MIRREKRRCDAETLMPGEKMSRQDYFVFAAGDHFDFIHLQKGLQRALMVV